MEHERRGRGPCGRGKIGTQKWARFPRAHRQKHERMRAPSSEISSRARVVRGRAVGSLRRQAGPSRTVGRSLMCVMRGLKVMSSNGSSPGRAMRSGCCSSTWRGRGGRRCV